ncbi:unnamed protein product [Nippostrongylus brasiliensis]|uniref:Secreted protein n=1 Tax=Nippostrongylus brasiliensis TaxID=27835 RepID=A0A0N4XET5_NIPBR|nr:unnamed protein product [Nippostrongylus brasiliensis]
MALCGSKDCAVIGYPSMVTVTHACQVATARAVCLAGWAFFSPPPIDRLPPPPPRHTQSGSSFIYPVPPRSRFLFSWRRIISFP